MKSKCENVYRRAVLKRLMGGVFVLLLAVLIALFVSLSASVPNPKYGGKPLSVWMDEVCALDYGKQTDSNAAPVKAVRAIGTNAIPWLLSELSADGSVWQFRVNQVLQKQSVIKFRFPDVNKRLRRGSIGFRVLGELGAPAIPELLKLVDTTPGYAPDALVSIGTSAIPAWHRCLTNKTEFVTSIGRYAPVPGNTIAAIQNAIYAGRISQADAEVFFPAIRMWAASTNAQAAWRANDFLKAFGTNAMNGGNASQ